MGSKEFIFLFLKKVRSVTDKQTDKTYTVRAPRTAQSPERVSLVGSLKSCTEPSGRMRLGVGFIVEVCEPDMSQGEGWGRRRVIIPPPPWL